MADTLYKSNSGIKVGDKHVAFPTFASLVRYDGENNVSVKEKIDEIVANVKYATTPRLGIYKANYIVDGWTDASSAEKANGYNYKQSVVLVAETKNAPGVTENSEFLTAGSVQSTGVVATDLTLQTALGVICDGYTETGSGTVTTLVKKKPNCDVVVRWGLMT